MSDNKTHDNLMAGFTGEAEANRKYTAYAKKAEKDGFLNAAKLFRAAADAETLHALKHFEVAGMVGDTASNLKDGIAGETYEYKEMYPPFIETAKAEGNNAAVMTFTFAMKAEEVHARLYEEALDNLEDFRKFSTTFAPHAETLKSLYPKDAAYAAYRGINLLNTKHKFLREC